MVVVIFFCIFNAIVLHPCVVGSAVPQNPVPLLPTDGGDFVAIQKKSLAEDFNDPHHVMTSSFYFCMLRNFC